MEDKLEIRVGDVVRLKPMRVFTDGPNLISVGPYPVFDGACVDSVATSSVEEIIGRAETEAEQIARLKRELEEQKADVRAAEKAFDDLQSRYNRLESHSTDLAQRYEAQVNYTQKLEARASLEDIAESVGGIMKPDDPWYPPRQEGYGPWIEGEPVGIKDGTRMIHCLSIFERANKNFEPISVEFRDWQSLVAGCVAHCIKLEVKA